MAVRGYSDLSVTAIVTDARYFSANECNALQVHGT